MGTKRVDQGSVSGNDDARDREAKEAHSKLDEGLKNCRAVVSSYRALLDKKRAGTGSDSDR